MNIWKALPDSKVCCYHRVPVVHTQQLLVALESTVSRQFPLSVYPHEYSKEEHLSVLHFECSKAAEKVTSETGVHLPGEVVGLATEAAYRFCQVLATDLEAFSRHAHRSTITTDDLLLFARRNPHLSAYIEAKAAELKPSATGSVDTSTDLPVEKKRRKTKTLTSISTNKAASTNSTLKFPPKAETPASSNQPSEVAQKSPAMGESILEDVMGDWFEDFDEDQC